MGQGVDTRAAQRNRGQILKQLVVDPAKVSDDANLVIRQVGSVLGPF